MVLTGSAVARTGVTVAGVVAAAHLLPGLLGVPGAANLVPVLTGPRHPGWIGLTFDDGPHTDGTRVILDQLDRFAVTATFFVVGEQLLRNPDIGRRVAGQGHELAVHGWNHRPLPSRPPGRIARELTDTRELIAAVTGAMPRWYRPPFGVATGETLWVARRLGLRPVWWNRWGRDWDRRATPARIARKVIGPPGRHRLHDGDVILLHDSDAYAAPGSWRATAAALPTILGYAARRGLRVGALDAGTPDGGRSSGGPTVSGAVGTR